MIKVLLKLPEKRGRGDVGELLICHHKEWIMSKPYESTYTSRYV